LGALCVAAAARAAGHEVKFLDLGVERKPQKALKQALEKEKFGAVAFGIRNLDSSWAFAPRSYFAEVQEFAETVRQHFVGPLILGGTGFSVSPQGWMQRLQPDCGVIGEGEFAFPEVLARLETGRSLEGIRGVLTTAGNDGRNTTPTPAIESLDQAAFNKPFGQEEIRIALQAAHEARLPMAIYLLFGGPGETWADVEDTQKFLDGCKPATAVFATVGIRVYEGAPIADVAVREGQVKPDQDLFEPAYYLSPGLADDTENKLDRIARRRAEWTSPADWRKTVVRYGQKVSVLLNVRPTWKYISSYGRHVRRKIP
jgi:radical SAM superfamily enzyme YgiQ (UPF0313 family)